ncbi:hypothetical protein E3N88_45309 [Mikania micrantha]|uniref:Uncharacterized protein n=1 Tax=Mikania micrantha TaxID=192012 RepID=A0A5N6L9H9_9ASTR|nr:hypothetical protein E3N88_45309 [Mikania micrantha]
MYRGGPQSTQSTVGEIIAEDRSQLNHDIPNMHKCQYSALRRTAVNSINSGITEEDRRILGSSDLAENEEREEFLGSSSSTLNPKHFILLQVF